MGSLSLKLHSGIVLLTYILATLPVDTTKHLTRRIQRVKMAYGSKPESKIYHGRKSIARGKGEAGEGPHPGARGQWRSVLFQPLTPGQATV